MSIVIATRNRHDFLTFVLGKVGSLVGPEDEIIVIDDGSAQPVQISESLGRLPIRLIRHEDSAGYITRRNELVVAARNEVVLQLDDDSWPVEADACRVVEEEMSNNPNFGAFAMPVHYHHEKNEGECGRPDPRWQSKHLAPEIAFMGCAAVLRRSAFLEVEGYPQYCKHGFEETVLAARLLSLGYDVRMNRRTRVIHGHEKLSDDPGYSKTRSDYKAVSLLASKLCFVREAFPLGFSTAVEFMLRLKASRAKHSWREISEEASARSEFIKTRWRMSGLVFLKYVARSFWCSLRRRIGK